MRQFLGRCFKNSYEISSGPVAFYFLDYTKYRESIASPQKMDFEILMNLHVLRAIESKSYFWPVCLSVCLSVCGHYNSKNNRASSTKFGM